MHQQTTVGKTIIQSLLFVILVFVFVSFAKAQSTNYSPVPISTDSIRKANPNLDKPDKNLIYQVVEKMPQFPGGDGALSKAIEKNIIYPRFEFEGFYGGKVIVKFIITKKGKISNAKILKSLDPFYDKKAIRTIKLLPKWIPGEHNGKKVNVYYTLPVIFRLQE